MRTYPTCSKACWHIVAKLWAILYQPSQHSRQKQMAQPFSLDFGLKETHVLVTGGCGLIGRVVVQAFLAAGANVSIIDLAESVKALAETTDAALLGNALICTADISKAKEIDTAFSHIEGRNGPVSKSEGKMHTRCTH